MNKKKWGLIFINISLLVITIIIFCLIFEVFLRIFYPQNLNPFMLDKEIGFIGKPFFETTYNKIEYNTTITLNSYGLRDNNEYELNKYRILVLGDSFTFSQGVDSNETYPKLLEKQLEKELKKDITVINAGIPGVGMDYYLNFIKKKSIDFNPDLVIVGFFIGNDITDTLKSHSFYKIINGSLCQKKVVEITTLQKIRIFLSSKSQVYNYIKELVYYTPIRQVVNNYFDVEKKEQSQLGFEYHIFDKEHSEIIENGFRRTEMILSDMNNYLKQKKIKLLVVIIPSKEELNKDMQEIIIKKFSLKEPNFDYPQKRIILLLKKEDINYIEMDKKFKGSNNYYYEIDKHWTKEGHKLAAEVIAEHLINGEIINVS